MDYIKTGRRIIAARQDKDMTGPGDAGTVAKGGRRHASILRRIRAFAARHAFIEADLVRDWQARLQLDELFSLYPHVVATIALVLVLVPALIGGQTLAATIGLAATLANMGFRAAMSQRYRKRRPDSALRPWIARFAFASIISGLLWGIALAAAYIGNDRPEIRLLVLAVAFGITQGTVLRAYHAPAPLVVHLCLTTLCLTLAFLWEESWTFFPVMVIFLAFEAIRIRRMVLIQGANLRAARDKEDLMARLEQTNRDLTAATIELSRRALTDGLTGLANRRAFDDAMRRHLAAGRPVGLILVDIDHFKAFNDTHGHLAGDLCLVAIARSIASLTAASRATPARYGGEEFAIILADATEAGCHALAETLRRTIADLPIDLGVKGKVRVTASLGHAVMAGETATPDLLFAAADKALYRAKRSGRNRVAGPPGRPDPGHQDNRLSRP